MIWRRIRQSRKRLLAQEADRATRWLGVVVVDAHRMGERDLEDAHFAEGWS